MCGIVGVIYGGTWGMGSTEMNVFETMLLLDTQRGWDSTGVFGVQKNNNTYVCKEASSGSQFLRHEAFKDLRSKMIQSGQFVVGHNRAATRGSVKDENAHPFWIDDKIILVQNGTMRGDHKKHKDVEVDTEAVAHVIAESESVEAALNKIDAAYALVWYNTEEKSLNIIRNDERPLYIARAEKNVLFASESNMILYAAARENMKLTQKPMMLNEHMLKKFILVEGGGFKEETMEINIKKGAGMSNVNFQHGRWRHGYGKHWHGQYDDDDDCTVDVDPVRAAIREVTRDPLPHRQSGAVLLLPNKIVHKKEELHFNFAECIIKSFPDFALSHEDKNSTSRALTTKSFEGYTAYVQLEDYIPANNNPDCTIFHVFGRDINPENNKVLYHWLMQDIVDETALMEMVTRADDFYKIEHTSGFQVNQCTINGETKFVVHKYCPTATLIKAVPVVNQTVDHQDALH